MALAGDFDGFTQNHRFRLGQKGSFNADGIKRTGDNLHRHQSKCAKNKLPQILNRQTLWIEKGDDQSIGRNLLQVVDQDQKPKKLVYTLTHAPKNGVLFLKGNPLQEGDRFTQRHINRGHLSYKSIPDILQVTASDRPKTLRGIADNRLVWEEFDGNDTEIFFHDLANGTTTQLTNNQFDDIVVGINQRRIVWSGLLEPADAWEDEYEAGPSNELYVFNGRKTTQLTNGAAHDKLISIDGRHLFWKSAIGPMPDWASYQSYSYELFYSNGKRTRQLTHNEDDDSARATNGKHIIWTSREKPKGGRLPSEELFWFNGKKITRLTHNNVEDWLAKMDFPYVAWHSKIGIPQKPRRTTYEVMLLNLKTLQQKRLTHNDVDDYILGIDGKSVVWSSSIGNRDRYGSQTSELFLFNGKKKIRLTRNSVDDYLDSFDGRNLFWESWLGVMDSDGIPTTELFWSNGRKTHQITHNDVDGSFADTRGAESLWISYGNSSDPNIRRYSNVYYSRRKKTWALTDDDTTFKWNARFTDEGIIWLNESGPSTDSSYPWATSELYYLDNKTEQTRRLTNNALDEENIRLAGSTLAWEQGLGQTTNILVGNVATSDRFRFTVSDRQGGMIRGRFRIRFYSPE
jgi:hypothetical protein